MRAMELLPSFPPFTKTVRCIDLGSSVFQANMTTDKITFLTNWYCRAL